MSDQIEHPSHYNLSKAKCSHCGERIECIDVASAFEFLPGSVIKYLWRTEYKNGIEDLKKAYFSLGQYIKRKEDEQHDAT